MYKASPISSVSKNDSYLINNDIHKKKKRTPINFKKWFLVHVYVFSDNFPESNTCLT